MCETSKDENNRTLRIIKKILGCKSKTCPGTFGTEDKGSDTRRVEGFEGGRSPGAFRSRETYLTRMCGSEEEW